MALEELVSRGAFIVFEGLDRSGKTTQVKRLEAELSKSGRKVKVLRFPDRTTPIGQMINSYLQSKSDLEDHVIHLLFSANRWELAKLIEIEIAQGCTIICDRYTYSGMVYSAAKFNPLLDIDWARNSDVHLPRPDIVVFLDLNLDEVVERGGYGDEKYEKRDMQELVRCIFMRLKEYGQEETEDLVVIDAAGSVDEVSQKITEAVRMKLAAVERGDMGQDIRRIKEWPPEKMAGELSQLKNELKQAKEEKETREKEAEETKESRGGHVLSMYQPGLRLFAKDKG